MVLLHILYSNLHVCLMRYRYDASPSAFTSITELLRESNLLMYALQETPEIWESTAAMAEIRKTWSNFWNFWSKRIHLRCYPSHHAFYVQNDCIVVNLWVFLSSVSGDLFNLGIFANFEFFCVIRFAKRSPLVRIHSLRYKRPSWTNVKKSSQMSTRI